VARPITAHNGLDGNGATGRNIFDMNRSALAIKGAESLLIILLLSILPLLTPACSKTVKVEPRDDISKYTDYATALKRLPGKEATQIQKEIGSPDTLERKDADHVDWTYKYKFWEPEAKVVYKGIVLHFEKGILKSLEVDP